MTKETFTAFGSEILEAEEFLRTPDAHRVLVRETDVPARGHEQQKRAAAPTYDQVIESVLDGEEPLEVVARPLAELGQRWMVTLKNYPHLVVFVSVNKSTCETVATTRRLVRSDE